MQKLLIATTNAAKLTEFRQLLSNLPVQIISLSDVGITDDVEEDRNTNEDNSKKKALFYSKLSGLPAIADDGGLEIVALNGEPGVHSRRWLGYKATDEELVAHMIKASKELPDDNRVAYFKTVITLALPSGRFFCVEGQIKGLIAKKPLLKLHKGYPYRSFFYLPEIKKYYHENDLTPEEMKKYNHRAKAVEKLKPVLEKYLV